MKYSIKFFIIIFFLFISGCSSILNISNLKNHNKIEVAVLLPHNDKYSELTDSLIQTLMYSYNKNPKNQNIIMRIYDTKGTKNGAKHAATTAINKGAQIIIGPLLTEETLGVAEVTEPLQIPVFSLSNSPIILDDNNYIFMFNHSLYNDYTTVISYMVNKQSAKTFSILLPNSFYGNQVEEIINRVANEQNIVLTNIQRYEENEVNMTSYIENLISEESKLERKHFVLNNPELEDDKTDEIPFLSLSSDGLIIIGNPEKISIIASHIPFLDIKLNYIHLIGNSTWKNHSKLLKDRFLISGIYPQLKDYHNSKLYKDIYSIYSREISLLDIAIYESFQQLTLSIYKDDSSLVSNFTKEYIISHPLSNSILGNLSINKNGLVEHNMSVVKLNGTTKPRILQK